MEKFSNVKLIRIEFATPTVFTQGTRGDTPMPMPEYVFGGLARRWNSTVPTQLVIPDNFQKEVYDNVTVSSFHGQTATVDIGDRLKKTGFVGQVSYRIHNPSIAIYCHLLAEAGFFTGVGAKTSRGMGCIRRLRVE